MSTAASGAAAAGAAAARRKRQQQEEEEMTTYRSQELSDGWEFKILRSVRSAFKNPERLQQVLADESRAGWTLVEKFDDSRIRLKRPMSARELDGKLEFDPYRTCYGPSENQVALTVLGVILAVVVFAMLLIAIVVNSNRDHPQPPTVPAVAPPVAAPEKLPEKVAPD